MTNAMWMRGVQWLAAAAPDPRACAEQWERDGGTVLLEAGRHWDVVSVPRHLGLLALDILWDDPLRAPGPTLVDSAALRVGFFVPPDAPGHWTGAGVRRAGKGAWVAVPPPYRPAGSLEWIVPPDGSGLLHPPVVLRRALTRAGRTLAVLATVSED